MITEDQYFGVYADSPDRTDEMNLNARKFLPISNAMQAEMEADGVVFQINPKTGSQISGETNGGFRPQACQDGAANSSHKEARAVDHFDPDGHIDDWIMAHQDRLEFYGIYIEHPDSTPGWSHWSDRAPGSCHHVFYP